MGLDLKLLPLEGSSQLLELEFSHTILNMDRNSRLFDYLQCAEKIHGWPVGEKFTSFLSREGGSETHYGRTVTTPYGERMLYLKAHHITAAAKRYYLDTHEKVSHINNAVLSYIIALPPDTPVALYWC